MFRKFIRINKLIEQSYNIQNQQTRLVALLNRRANYLKEIMKAIQFTIALKNIKYLGINLTKGVKDLFNEIYKTDGKIKTYKNESYPIFTEE